MKRLLATLILIVVIFSLASCNLFVPTGTLQGSILINAYAPVAVPDSSSPVLNPEAFTNRSVEILKAGEDKVYESVNFKTDGTFSIDLPEGNYIVRLPPSAVDTADGLPTSVKITSGQVTKLNIVLDTGIR